MTTTTRTNQSSLTAYIARHAEWLAVLFCALILQAIPHLAGIERELTPPVHALCELSGVFAFVVAAVLATLIPAKKRRKFQ